MATVAGSGHCVKRIILNDYTTRYSWNAMRTYPVLMIINIMICVFLLADAYVFKRNTRIDRISDFHSKETRSRSTRYLNYFVITSNGNRYEVPAFHYENLDTGVAVIVSSSFVLHMPLEMQYKKNNETVTLKTGQLNGRISETYGLLLSGVLSIIVLMAGSRKGSRNKEPLFALQVLAISTTMVVLAFVIIQLLST